MMDGSNPPTSFAVVIRNIKVVVVVVVVVVEKDSYGSVGEGFFMFFS